MLQAALRGTLVFFGILTAAIVAAQDVGVETPKRMKAVLTSAAGRNAVVAGTAYLLSRDVATTLAVVLLHNLAVLGLADPSPPGAAGAGLDPKRE